MENVPFGNPQDGDEKKPKDEVSERVQPEIHMIYNPREEPVRGKDIPEVHKDDYKSSDIVSDQVDPASLHASGDVNMEAYVRADDVIRAGGLGARDDISSFLPIASDSTDFEASLRDARDYEELPDKTDRPGLGYKGDTSE